VKTGQIFENLLDSWLTIRNESFKFRIRDPRYDTNSWSKIQIEPFEVWIRFVIPELNLKKIWICDPPKSIQIHGLVIPRINANPWIHNTNPQFPDMNPVTLII
jgi:hypothetical protein